MAAQTPTPDFTVTTAPNYEPDYGKFYNISPERCLEITALLESVAPQFEPVPANCLDSDGDVNHQVLMVRMVAAFSHELRSADELAFCLTRGLCASFLATLDKMSQANH